MLKHAMHQVCCCAEGMRTAADLIESPGLAMVLRQRADGWRNLAIELGAWTAGPQVAGGEFLHGPDASLRRALIKIKAGSNDFHGVVDECRWWEAIATRCCVDLLRTPQPRDIRRPIERLLKFLNGGLPGLSVQIPIASSGRQSADP